MANLTLEVRRIRMSLEAFKKKHEDAEGKLDMLEEEITKIEGDLAQLPNLQRALKKKEQELTSVEREYRDSGLPGQEQQKNEDAHNTLNNEMTKIEEDIAELAGLQKTLKQKKQELTPIKTELSRLKREKSKLERELDTLNRHLEEGWDNIRRR